MSGIVVVHAPPIREDRYDDILRRLRAEGTDALHHEAAEYVESLKRLEDSVFSLPQSQIPIQRGESGKR